MTVELKRMLQRRGLKADLPASGREGEIYLTLDTGELYFSNGVQYFNTLTTGSIVNDLISNDTDKALSANQGRLLDNRISNINTYWDNYTQNLLQVVNDKQDIILYKGSSAPNDVNLFWQKTE